MSQIEEGCMAIVTGNPESPNTGKIVQVGKFVGVPGKVKSKESFLNITAKDCWEVSQEILWNVPNGTPNRMPVPFLEEHRLQRIDNTDTEKQTDHEIEEEISG